MSVAKKNQLGFSLLEITIALVIAAIIATFAIPSSISSIRNAQLRSSIDQAGALAHFAKSQALSGKTIGIRIAASPPNTLEVNDLSNPASPKTIKTLSFPLRYSLSAIFYTPNASLVASQSWGPVNPLYAQYPIIFTPSGFAPLLNANGQVYGQAPWGEIKIQDPYTEILSGRAQVGMKYIGYLRVTNGSAISKNYGIQQQ